MMHYILEEDHSTHQARSDEEYYAQWKLWSDRGKFVKGHPKVVDKTTVGTAEVSTVFLGLDHSFGDGPPILFETMVFYGDSGDYTERYATWDEAVKGHVEIVAKLERGEDLE